MHVQALIPETSVEGLDVAILYRPAGGAFCPLGRRTKLRTILSVRFARVSSSHKRFTDSDHPTAFCTSSRTRTAPRGPLDRRAVSPLLGDPVGTAKSWRRLTDLPRVGHRLDVSARLPKSAGGEPFGAL